MKKKIIILITIIVIIGVVVFLGLAFLKKEKEPELTYTKEVIGASTETKYLSESIGKILSYLNNNEIKEKTTFDKINIQIPNYEKCKGTITPQKDNYLVEANCGNDEDDGYNINMSISKKQNLKDVIAFITTKDGNIYYGKSKEEKRVSVGFIDNDMNIKWEAKIPVLSNDSIITQVNSLSDGYLVVIANMANNDLDYYDLIKIDKNGKVVKNEKTFSDYTVSNTSDDVILLQTPENSAILLDKNIKRIDEIDLIKPTVSLIEKNNIYYIDEDKNLHIIDKKGKEKLSVKIDTNDTGYFQIEIMNNKIFVVGDKNITTYNKNGDKLNTFNYSNLRIDRKNPNSDYLGMAIFDVRKVEDLISVNVLLEDCLLVDYYDDNLEHVHRNIYESLDFDMGAEYFNNIVLGNDVPYSLNYSDKYSRFVRINYID